MVSVIPCQSGVAELGILYGRDDWPIDYAYSRNQTASTAETRSEEEALAKQAEFKWKLLHAIENEPLENGYSHPAEFIIGQALKISEQTAVSWIQSVYFDHLERKPVISAVILRCIGRVARDQVYPWGFLMASNGLYHSDIEVRDAAVRAFEMWEDTSSFEILREHDEKVPWLADYIARVISDLEKLRGNSLGVSRTKNQ